MVFGFAVIGLVALLTAVYFYIKYMYSYWERRGVPTIKPIFPYGNLATLDKEHNHSELIQFIYQELKGTAAPFAGLYMFNQPVAVALDLDFIKNVFITDFSYFVDRGFYFNEKYDPLSTNLFSMDGKEWKILRAKFSPTFTSGKMKFMYSTLIKVADQLKATTSQYLSNDENKIIDIRDLVGRFNTDVIGECALGIECNSLKNPNSEFREIGKKVFELPRHDPSLFFLANSYPNIARIFRMKVTREEVEKFFLTLTTETVEFREKNNVSRNDFMDLLIDIKKQDLLKGDVKEQITMEQMAAQVFVFFIGGYETASSTMSFALYELALNLDIQNRARDEIRKVLKKHDGHFTYEAMMDMTYIDQIINESLRKYPPGGAIFRKVTKDYKVPGTEQILSKGTQLFIPVLGIQRDPEYYPEPDVFNPDRFSEDEVKNRNRMTFLPFGDGPRNCIGLRFGMMQTRVGLVTLLLNYEFTTCKKTTIPIKIAKKTLFVSPDGDVWLNVRKI